MRQPQLGVLHFGYGESCIIADIPGLIEGAHEGVGLGHRFLKHIERTSILLHVIDCSTEDEQPLQDFRVLEKELEAYNRELLGRRYVIVLNKRVNDLVEVSIGGNKKFLARPGVKGKNKAIKIVKPITKEEITELEV